MEEWKMTIQQEITLTVDQLCELIIEDNLSDEEKLKILKALFKTRAITDRTKLMGEVNEFIILNMY